MEAESMRFYQAAAKRTTNLALRKLLDELPLAEQLHLDLAGKLHREVEESGARNAEDQTHRRTFASSDHSTRSGGTHGWICLDLSSRLRGRLCHPGQLGRLSHRHGRLYRRRN